MWQQSEESDDVCVGLKRYRLDFFHIVLNVDDVSDLSLGDVHVISLDDIHSRQNGKDLVRIIA